MEQLQSWFAQSVWTQTTWNSLDFYGYEAPSYLSVSLDRHTPKVVFLNCFCIIAFTCKKISLSIIFPDISLKCVNHTIGKSYQWNNGHLFTNVINNSCHLLLYKRDKNTFHVMRLWAELKIIQNLILAWQSRANTIYKITCTHTVLVRHKGGNIIFSASGTHKHTLMGHVYPRGYVEGI